LDDLPADGGKVEGICGKGMKYFVFLQNKKQSTMGKLAIILCYILSVFPADKNENRRHKNKY
jgi:hypothetical protein